MRPSPKSRGDANPDAYAQPSILTFAAFTTSAHFLISSATKASKAFGSRRFTAMPSLVAASATSGFFNAASTAPESLSSTAGGVAAGAPQPTHAAASPPPPPSPPTG